MVDIKKTGKYYYVEGNDSYIFYYLFKFRLNNNKCFFYRKHLERVINELKKKKINYRLNKKYYNDDNKYIKYLELGKNKYLFDSTLLNIENKLNNITDSKKFNKIYRKIIKEIYE